MKKKKIRMSDVVPFLVLAGLMILFTALSRGKYLSTYNIRSIVEAALPFIIGGLGMIFVVAMGCTDLSQGSLQGLTAIFCVIAGAQLGAWFIFPVGLLCGAVVGVFTGTIVEKFKVRSFLVTLALLIALRAAIQLMLSYNSVLATTSIIKLNSLGIKFPLVIGFTIVCWYLFEKTRFGYYCKGIGENEMTIRSSGIDVLKYKILAFAISGAMAGLSGAFAIARSGGANAALGNMFEMRVMMALCIGGIPISGGTGAKMYKLIVGAFVVAALENGLTICGVASALYEFIEGLTLIIVVAVTLYFRSKADSKKAILRPKEKASA